MSEQTFTTHGFTVEFTDNSGEILAALKNAVQRGLESIGETAVGYAKDALTSQGAVDTGELRGSVNYKVVDDECYIGTDAEHGVYIELGTGKYSTEGGGTTKERWVYQDDFGEWHMAYPQRARPFLKPAASDHTEEYRGILKDSLENA